MYRIRNETHKIVDKNVLNEIKHWQLFFVAILTLYVVYIYETMYFVVIVHFVSCCLFGFLAFAPSRLFSSSSHILHFKCVLIQKRNQQTNNNNNSTNQIHWYTKRSRNKRKDRNIRNATNEQQLTKGISIRLTESCFFSLFRVQVICVTRVNIVHV